jgi:hypothetical protein
MLLESKSKNSLYRQDHTKSKQTFRSIAAFSINDGVDMPDLSHFMSKDGIISQSQIRNIET